MGLLRARYVIPAVLVAIQAYRSVHPVSILILTNPTLPSSYFASPDSGKPGTCTVLHDPIAGELNSCEDIHFWDVLDSSDGDADTKASLLQRRLLMSCDPNRKNWNTVMGPLNDPNPLGQFWIADIASDGQITTPKKLTLKGLPAGTDFHPLGFDISPAHSLKGTSNLFIVNHARQHTNILHFRLSPATPTVATYVRTIAHRWALNSANAIALTSDKSFYVTNDHLMTRRLPSVLGHTLPLVETLLALPLGYLTHVDIVSEGAENDPSSAVIRHTFPKLIMPFPNGVALSPDGSELAISSSSLAEVHIYRRVPGSLGKGDDQLTLAARVPVSFAPDNVEYTHEGAILVTGHPHFPALVDVAANKTGASARSWVVSISHDASDTSSATGKLETYDTEAPYSSAKSVSVRALPSNYSVRTVYQSNGRVSEGGFGGSTTTVWDERSGLTFVSGLYESGILVCRSDS